jgi:hypothetical protein
MEQRKSHLFAFHSRYSRATSDEPTQFLARIVALLFQGVAKTFAVPAQSAVAATLCRRTP